MERRAQELGRGRFDLLVIGGGIAGAWTAYEAALRGLRVGLVEGCDWGAGTSSASSKLIHGGLRYLEHGHVGLVAKSLRERARLLRLGPHRIRPLRFLVPIFPDSRFDRVTLALGLRLYDLLAGPRHGVPSHRYLDAAGLCGEAPLFAAGLLGGFTYGDAGSDDARFTLEIVAGALAAGAVAVNHAVVDHLLRDRNGLVAGALVVDGEGGKAYDVQARLTVNAAGPWAGGLVPQAMAPPVRLSKGVHLVMPPLPLPGGSQPDLALLLTAASDRRVFFLIPWYGATLLGTTDTAFLGDPDHLRVEQDERDYLLSEANRRCPVLGWGPTDIRGGFAGLRVLQGSGGGSVGAASREWRLCEPLPGLLMPVGGKFTSARIEAVRTVDRACQRLGLPSRGSATADRALPWRPAGSWHDWLAQAVTAGIALGLDGEVAETCARRHGSRLVEVHRRIAADRSLAQRVCPQAPFCLAEIAQAVAREMALDTEDVLRRRVPVNLLAVLSQPQLSRVDAVMASARAGTGMSGNPT